MTVDDIIKKAKKVLIWSKTYWDRKELLPGEYNQGEINEAFNNWNWSERELKEAIIAYEDEQKKRRSKTESRKTLYEYKKIIGDKPMLNDKKKFTRLTIESSYGTKQTYEFDSEDVCAEELISAFYALMIGSTYQETSTLELMKQFAEDKLKVLKRDQEDKTDKTVDDE